MFVAETEACPEPEYRQDTTYVVRAIALGVFFGGND
jgi:hypothetical protein